VQGRPPREHQAHSVAATLNRFLTLGPVVRSGRNLLNEAANEVAFVVLLAVTLAQPF